MNTIFDFNFKKKINLYIFFILQLIFIKIKSRSDYYFYDENNVLHDHLTFDECIYNGYTYYNIEQKQCFKICNEYIVDKGDIKGNCFTSCPTNYPFHYVSGTIKKCLASCPTNYYYKDFICYVGCPTGYLYHFKNQYECMTYNDCASKASNVIIYYDPSTKICDFSCKDFGENKYIFENDNSPIQCRSKSECDNHNRYKYYYDGIYKCLSSCPYFYDGSDSHKCLDKCSPDDNKYVDTGDKCVDSCPEYKYRVEYKGFMVDKCINECESHIVSNRDRKRCLDSCPENERYNL